MWVETVRAGLAGAAEGSRMTNGNLGLEVDLQNLQQAVPWLADIAAILDRRVRPNIHNAQEYFGDPGSGAASGETSGAGSLTGRVYGTTPGAQQLTGKVMGMLSGMDQTLQAVVTDLDKLVDATGKIAERYQTTEALNHAKVNDINSAFEHANAEAGAAVAEKAHVPPLSPPTPPHEPPSHDPPRHDSPPRGPAGVRGV